MKTKHIKLQVEKLKVIESLLKNIETENEESTREMLVKLKNEIEELLFSDF